MPTTQWVFELAARHIQYVRYTLEAYDGMAVVRTVDPNKAVVEITVARGCEEMVAELLGSLMECEGVMMLKKGTPS
jgi:hypothetical protein